MAYQSFPDTKGHSKSDEKFKKIRLGDLTGKAVLDLGCNEGYFCNKAIQAGASRVVGIDQSEPFIMRAKQRFPSIDFRCQSWESLPEGKFDVIIFLSAIHYEKNQPELLQRLHDALNIGGKLILECGVAPGEDAKWTRVHRKVGSVLYPTESLLKEYLLKNFAIRNFGESVMQAGDQVKRYVFHATPKEKTVVFITGKSHTGKTNLSKVLRKSAAVVSLDEHLQDMIQYEQSELSNFLKHDFSQYQLSKVYQKINQSQYIAEYCTAVLESLPSNDLTFIEGWGLSLKNIQEGMTNAAKNKHYRIWGMGRIESVDT